MPLPIPPVDPATTRRLAAENQRDRLLYAVMTTVARAGYARATVSDVIAVAGVSRRTFYEHFANIEDCFVAAYELGSTRLHRIVGEASAAMPGDAPWQQAIGTSVAAYLTAFADQPEFAYAAMIEVLAAGQRARALYLENVATFEQLVRAFVDRVDRSEGVPPVSDTAISLALGGLARFVVVELLAGRATSLPTHADELTAALVKLIE